MPTYSVTVPFIGSFTIYVEAPTEKDAESAALSSDVNLTVKGGEESQLMDWEWEAHRQICQGNVLYARTNKIRVEAVDDNDE